MRKGFVGKHTLNVDMLCGENMPGENMSLPQQKGYAFFFAEWLCEERQVLRKGSVLLMQKGYARKGRLMKVCLCPTFSNPCERTRGKMKRTSKFWMILIGVSNMLLTSLAGDLSAILASTLQLPISCAVHGWTAGWLQVSWQLGHPNAWQGHTFKEQVRDMMTCLLGSCRAAGL